MNLINKIKSWLHAFKEKEDVQNKEEVLKSNE